MKGMAVLAVVSLALSALACNKGPAEEALGIADQDIGAARPELERYAPGELAALTADVQQARAQLGQGHYTEALKAAQKMPGRVRAALAVAAVEKDRQVGTWKELAESVPRLEQTITTRIAWLTEGQRLPRGMDEAAFAAVPAELESVKRAWGEASATFQGGDVATAVRTGREVEGRAEVLATRLGLVFATPPPSVPPTPTPSPTPAPAAP